MNVLVRINDWSFQYDAYHLVKSFYQDEEVAVEPFSAGETGDVHGGVRKSEARICVDIVIDSNAIRAFYLEQEEEAGSPGKARGQRGGADLKEHAYADEERDPDRITVKNIMKRLVYDLLKEKTGRELPWGTLSGIRPTKIPYKLKERGHTDEDILRHMRENFYVSPEKARLALDIAKRELGIIGSTAEAQKGYSIYVSVPFCPSICSYCTFSSGRIDDYKDRIDDYIRALGYEMERAADIVKGRKLSCIYVGGGTPTSLSAGDLSRVLDAIGRVFPADAASEYTVEAGRPDTLTKDKLKVIKDHGAERISINPQTMNDDTLALIGRKHTVSQTKEAFYLARSEGFDNINTDIIEGLPGEGDAHRIRTFEAIKELGPECLTVHSLALKRASGLSINNEIFRDYASENTQAVMDMAAGYAKDMGMFPYYLYRQKNIRGNLENTGYAVPGKECLYNMLIMEERQSVLAFGAGAITKYVYGDGEAVRAANVKNVDEYIGRIDEMIMRKVNICDVLSTHS